MLLKLNSFQKNQPGENFPRCYMALNKKYQKDPKRDRVKIPYLSCRECALAAFVRFLTRVQLNVCFKIPNVSYWQFNAFNAGFLGYKVFSRYLQLNTI